MKILKDRKCTIGEGPFWNEREGWLYFTNAAGFTLPYQSETKGRPPYIFGKGSA